MAKRRSPKKPSPPPKPARPDFRIGIILAVAFVIRVAYLILSRESPFYEPLLLDPAFYHQWALRILKGDWGSGVFYGLPLYPFFLAACYKIFHSSLFAVKFIQLLLGLAAVFFVYKIGDRIASRKAGLLAAGLAAVYGPLFFHEQILIPEAIGVPLYAAAFYAACLFEEDATVAKALGFGLLSGLAMLTKAGILPFFLIAVFILFWKRKPGVPKMFTTAVALASFFLVLAPVSAHNFIRGKDRVWLTSHAGFNFYIGNNPSAEGVFKAPEGTGSNVESQMEDSRALAEQAMGRSLKPSEVSKYWSDKAKDFVRENPGRFLRLGVRKIALFFDAREISDIDDYAFAENFNPFLRFPWPNFALLGPLLVAGLVAAVRVRHRFLIYLFIFSYLFGIALFFVNARYRLPLLGIFFVLGTLGVLEAMESIRRGDWTRGTVLALAFIGGIFLTRLNLVGPNWARDYVNAGDVYLEKDRVPEALDFYRKALTINPQHAKANLGMGVALSKMKRYEEAKEHYLRTLELDARNSLAWNNLGLWYDSQGESQRAEECFLKAIDIKPHSAPAHNNLGMVYGKSGQNEKASEAFRTALKLNPSSAKTYTNLGLVLYRMGKKGEAVDAWQKALKIDPAFSEARKALNLAQSE